MAGKTLAQRVHQTIDRHRMLAEGETVVVGVSGGPDSTALLHLLAELRTRLRLSLHVAHFNHRLRPGAGDDAAFVAEMSRALGVSYHEGAGETRALAARLHLSVEDAARRLRYEFFTSVARNVGAQAVATGHTRDDQAETVLMRLVRGSGLRGLAGIPPVRMLDGLRVIRPLLEVRRVELEAYLAAGGVTWREDPTNRDPAILRNRIRMVVLPAIEGYNPDIGDTLARLAGFLRDEADALDQLAAPQIAGVLAGGPDVVRISRAAFVRLPAALQRRALREAVRQVRGNLNSVGLVHVEEARRSIIEGQSGAVAQFPGGVQVTILSSDAEVTVPAGREAAAPAEYRLDVPGSVVAPEFGVMLSAAEVDATDAAARGYRPGAEDIMVEAGRVGGTLILRGPRAGDRFAPYGMRGRTKKLSDYLGEVKVPRHRRRFVPVLTTASGEVLWIVGVRAAESARIGGDAGRIVRIAARKLRA